MDILGDDDMGAEPRSQRRRRPGGRVESPACAWFKSVVVFFEALKIVDQADA